MKKIGIYDHTFQITRGIVFLDKLSIALKLLKSSQNLNPLNHQVHSFIVTLFQVSEKIKLYLKQKKRKSV